MAFILISSKYIKKKKKIRAFRRIALYYHYDMLYCSANGSQRNDNIRIAYTYTYSYF